MELNNKHSMLNFYLFTLLDRPKYMELRAKLIPDEFIDENK